MTLDKIIKYYLSNYLPRSFFLKIIHTTLSIASHIVTIWTFPPLSSVFSSPQYFKSWCHPTNSFLVWFWDNGGYLVIKVEDKIITFGPNNFVITSNALGWIQRSKIHLMFIKWNDYWILNYESFIGNHHDERFWLYLWVKWIFISCGENLLFGFVASNLSNFLQTSNISYSWIIYI